MKKITFIFLILFLTVWVGAMSTKTSQVFPGWLDSDGKLAKSLAPYLGHDSAMGRTLRDLSAQVPDWFGSDYRAILASSAVPSHAAPVQAAPAAHEPPAMPMAAPVVQAPVAQEPVVPAPVQAVRIPPPAPLEPMAPVALTELSPAAPPMPLESAPVLDQSAAFQAGRQACIADPASCGIEVAGGTPTHGGKPATLSWQGGVMEIPLVEVMEIDRWSGRPTGKKSNYRASMRYIPQSGSWHMVQWQPVTR